MEVWINDFNKNANILLDALNLIDNKENRQKLIENGLNDTNINNEREKLLQLLGKKHDPLKNTDINHVNVIHRNDTIYYDGLLTLDNDICLLLKHITNLIEYGWQYSNYC